VPGLRNYSRTQTYVNPYSTPQIAEACAAKYYNLSKLKASYKPAFAERDVGESWTKEFSAKDMSQRQGVLLQDPLVGVFQQLDSNHSGNISLQEMNWALQNLGLSKALIEMQIASFDAASKDISELEGGAGNVSMAEWEKGLLPEVRALLEPRIDKLTGKIVGFEAMVDYDATFRTFMRYFDTDGSGKLTLAELFKALQALKMASKDINKFISLFATDKDGYIGKAEFLKILSTENLDHLNQLLIKNGYMRANAAQKAAEKEHKFAHLRSSVTYGS